MELRVLRYFLAVAREQSISGAAELLHITQPTLSRQLMDLEAELGTKLLIRGKKNRRVELTEDGLLLRSRAEEIVALTDKTEADLTKYNALALPAAETWGVLMREDSELAAQETVSPEKLLDKPLILSQQSVAHNELAGWLGTEPERLNVTATYNLIYNASLLVEAGLGYAITIDKLVNTEGRPLTFRPLEPRLEGRLNLVWKKYHAFSRAAELFVRELRGE